ncbi:hypothetical protein R1sor_023389 [Riccia sorocarpa]|uniref:Uncharacterized protein n=1 Tax=Riccia sorocarpa TaxID=122646 RepID=A0ABD3GMG9_9MARC
MSITSSTDKKVKNFDVYLQPLVEELQQLWTGVEDVYDGRTTRIGRDRWFTLKVLPIARSVRLSKQVYMQYSTFLPLDHPLRVTGLERNVEEPPQPLDMNWWAQRWADVEDGNRGRPFRFPTLREYMQEKLRQGQAQDESVRHYPPITSDIKVLQERPSVTVIGDVDPS